jgi:acyl-CoA hydrolase
VTVAIDSLTFLSPVHVGDLVMFEAQVTYVGRTSIEVEVHVHAENVLSGQRTHTNSAYMVFVALGPDGRPAEAPPLIVETDEERVRYEAAQRRQSERLARRKK